MLKNLNRLLEVPSTDPSDARRRKLLTILLVGVALLSLLVVVLTAAASIFHLTGSTEESLPIYVIGLTLFLATIIIYWINRQSRLGNLASFLFLLMWMLVLPFSDVPKEVATGRSLFTFTIPIVMASVLLPPVSTFIFAGLSSIVITIVSISINDIPNVPAILGFFLIALVAWLSARSLENALSELVLVNRELDKRVVERTQALSEALTREREEAGRIQAILEGIADGVIVLDNSMIAQIVNPSLEPLVGRPASEILGKSLDEWADFAEISPADRNAMQRFFSDPASVEGNLKVQWGRKTLSISTAAVIIPGGEMIGQVAVFHDFTREAEVDRMKSGFVAMVSHELRTPLNSILGYTDMLREGIYGKLEERQSGIVERIITNTHKLLSIVNDLLDQAQIEAGRLSFHNRHFRPSELSDHMHGVMDGIIQSKKLRLEIEVTADLPKMLYGDPQRINQVLVNLVNNAVKFTEQGCVTIRFSRYDDQHWSMAVIDTGVGIPLEAQKFIFEPFRQVDSEITRRPGGIGLGLSIVKRLVNMMHGDIYVTSQVGSGSTFTVTLPLDGNEQEKETQKNE